MNRVIDRKWAPALVLARAKTYGVLTVPPKQNDLRQVSRCLPGPNVIEFDQLPQ